MKIILIGAGMMGQAIAYNLSTRDEVEQIVVADRALARAEAIAERLRDTRIVPQRLDASAPRAVREAMDGCNVAISAVPYFLNLSLAQAAVESGVSFCDLGGNNRIVAGELALDARAKKAGVTIIPDCGLAPGLVNILAAAAVEDFNNVESVSIRVGGLPQHPRPPLGYQIVFSPHGLINEYMEPSTVLRDGEIVTVPSLSEREEISFPPPYDKLEAFHTSGGSSTLPQTMHGRVRNLEYKTIRYPGHLEKIRAMADLGFFDNDPQDIDGVDIVPRALSVHLLREHLSFDEPDVILLRVSARGTIDGDAREIRYEMIDNYDESTGLSAMMRTTGFPIAQIAFMLATGEITARGALPQEMCVPTQGFLSGLMEHGLTIERTVIDA
ncbi:MAG TPA: saccharopine dehydrogenase [Candidatus Acetothermia bacterium]|nr:saccharopine dehydrogenase [Candidatus Acetothermia bacterium]